MTWPFGDLKRGHYRAILADPPWTFKLRSAKGAHKSPQRHYECMGWHDLAALPVRELAAPSCMLFMWATWPKIADALALMRAWGFTYKSGGAWLKTTASGKPAFGTGYTLRSSCEPFLIGALGAVKYVSRSERNVITALRREHSRKPDEQYGIIERLIPGGPYAELFARTTRPGWDSWGNEVRRFDPAMARAA